MPRLTDETGSPRSFAARVKLPASATRAKSAIWFRSIFVIRATVSCSEADYPQVEQKHRLKPNGGFRHEIEAISRRRVTPAARTDFHRVRFELLPALPAPTARSARGP